MPRTESRWDRRMRENRTSGGRRSEATVHEWYADTKAHKGKPRNRSMPTPNPLQFLAYSTSGKRAGRGRCWLNVEGLNDGNATVFPQKNCVPGRRDLGSGTRAGAWCLGNKSKCRPSHTALAGVYHTSGNPRRGDSFRDRRMVSWTGCSVVRSSSVTSNRLSRRPRTIGHGPQTNSVNRYTN